LFDESLIFQLSTLDSKMEVVSNILVNRISRNIQIVDFSKLEGISGLINSVFCLFLIEGFVGIFFVRKKSKTISQKI